MKRMSSIAGHLALMAVFCALAYADSLSRQEQEAKFPADLGPETIDVSSYPEYHRQSYDFFRHACTVCHTSARAVNSPLTRYDDWRRYVRRMHLRAQSQLLTKEDARRLVDFLVYDSHQRKIQNKELFDAFLKTLDKRFSDAQNKKAQALRNAKTTTKEPAPYTGSR